MSPPLPNEEQMGRDVKILIAQKFDKIGRLSRFYLTQDLDFIAEKTITGIIRYLERIHSDFNRLLKTVPSGAQTRFYKLSIRIEGQVKQIVPLMYNARRAKKNDDMLEFYMMIQESRTYWNNILDLLRRELS